MKDTCVLVLWITVVLECTHKPIVINQATMKIVDYFQMIFLRQTTPAFCHLHTGHKDEEHELVSLFFHRMVCLEKYDIKQTDYLSLFWVIFL